VGLSLINVIVLALFVVGGGLVALMVTITQRSYKQDEQSEFWVVYPSAERGARQARGEDASPVPEEA
jgi:hypothetical protein